MSLQVNARKFKAHAFKSGTVDTILAKTTDYTLIIVPDDYVPNEKPYFFPLNCPPHPQNNVEPTQNAPSTKQHWSVGERGRLL